MRRHARPEDRNVAPLRPRREVFESLFAYALYLSARRRQQKRVRPAPINQVADGGHIWCQPREGQPKLLELYREHVFYLAYGRRRRPGEHHGRAERDHISLRTLRRHLAGFRRDRRVTVGNYSDFDRARGEWIQKPNVYTITRAGVLWIKQHARALKIPNLL